MKEMRARQYTVRDIPEAVDLRLRETARLERISLNQAVVRALERGIGLTGERVRCRTLGQLVRPSDKVDRKGWSEALGSLDKINTEDWK